MSSLKDVIESLRRQKDVRGDPMPLTGLIDARTLRPIQIKVNPRLPEGAWLIRCGDQTFYSDGSGKP